MSPPRPVVIDTDPGLDDALALALALRSLSLEVRAITVVAGNVSLPVCTANVLRVLEALDLDRPPPVFPGCSRPLSPPVARAEHVHGGDGLGGASRRFPVRRLRAASGHAAEAINRLASELGRELTVISLGPLTNLATALKRDPGPLSGIGELVVMGGSADGGGNATPNAEFNFYADPTSARIVVRAGLPVTLVGLTVTEKARLPRVRFERCVDGMRPGTLRSFLAAVGGPYFDFCRKDHGSDSCAMHDPLAVAAAIDPGLIETEPMACDVVDSQGLTRGMLEAWPAGGDTGIPPIRVATSVDAAAFADLFLETIGKR